MCQELCALLRWNKKLYDLDSSELLNHLKCFMFTELKFPPLCQSLALVVSGGLQVSLQTFLLRLQLLGVVGLEALAGADVLQLLQQLLLLVDEDEAVSLWVQQPRPRLAV